MKITYRKGWIERRAARLMAAFGVDRDTAIVEAAQDWLAFVGSRP